MNEKEIIEEYEQKRIEALSKNIAWATEITSCTLIGPDRSLPCKRGNCFSVKTEDDRDFGIINFFYENLHVLVGRRKIKYPVRIKVIGKRTAVIHDERIEEKWYNDRLL